MSIVTAVFLGDLPLVRLFVAYMTLLVKCTCIHLADTSRVSYDRYLRVTMRNTDFR